MSARHSSKSSPFILLVGSFFLLVGVFSLSFLYTKPAAAAITNWNAGRIIDDSVFTNASSMSAQQIQQFLSSKVSNCDTWGTQPSEYGGGTRRQWAESRGYAAPFTCIKDYSENGKSAAQIIYDASQEFTINPQIILVLLQKEQGLITDTWPLSIQYRSATGYGCPDTAPCSTEYYGLTNQVRWAARMFRAIMNASPSWYTPYTVGNNYIRWSPTTSCGGTVVNIENRATQALYNYTPYQPNQAALNADYGSGDGCSAYGNRNFYLYFRDWFGNTTGPEYSAVIHSTLLYSDSSRTTPINQIDGKYILRPNQTVYARVNATNNGRGVWDSLTNIGTSGPKDRSSALSTADWINPQRAARVSTLNTQPYSSSYFDFSMRTPAVTGNYSESFALVRDGRAWFNNEFTYRIQVAESTTIDQAYSGHTLPANTKLSIGDVAISPDRYSSVSISPDGRLEIRRDYTTVWSSPASAGAGGYVVVQGDGNLVLYSAAGTPVWHTGTNGRGASSLSIQEDGNLVLYSQTGPTWSSGTNTGLGHSSYPTMTMGHDGVLYAGQLMESTDRKYALHLQSDGNLVLYSNTGPLWSSRTVGSTAHKLIMQGDGNLVLYNKSNRAVWNSGTASGGISSFSVQPDGNLVVYRANGAASWASGTNR